MNKLLALLLMLVGICETCAADILVFGELTAEAYGLVQSETDSTITFSVYDEMSHRLKTETFDRTVIAQVIRTIDQNRLRQLSPQQLADYRDYAEELATIPRDRFARDCALRLILICLSRDCVSAADHAIQASAARNLSPLATDESERRTFNALARRYVANLSPQTRPPLPFDGQAAKQTMLEIVQSLRRGQFESASRLLASKEGTVACDLWCQSTSGVCTPDSLLGATRLHLVTNDMLAGLIALEIDIRFGAGERPQSPLPNSSDWRHQHRGRPTDISWLPRVVDVSPFDLRNNVFRDQQWQQPAPARRIPKQ